MKKCTKCKKNKELKQFGICKRNKDGFMTQCKECHNSYKSVYRSENPEIYSKSNKNFYRNHRSEVLERNRKWKTENLDLYKDIKKNAPSSRKEVKSAYYKQYRDKNKEKLNEASREWYANNRAYAISQKHEYVKKKIKSDTNFRIARSLRNRTSKAIKTHQKSGSAVKDLGCSIEELKRYLESKFYNNMTWKNYGFGYGKWQIDHIMPLHKFDLSDREEFLKACNFSNLQPLWYEDHILKTNRDRK